MRNSKSPFAKLVTLLLFSSILAQASHACMCPMVLLRIDSLAQMNVYDFIAHVRITGDEIYKKPGKDNIETIGQLRFEIIELFKGEKTDRILEYAKNSSCDIGVSNGEEWILFGRKMKGMLSIVACDRNQRYKEKNELRDWKYGRGFYELKMLKSLYGHTIPETRDGKHVVFYKNGKTEIEETYVRGKLHGERRIWYPNGNFFCREFYINDSLDGKSEWFYPSGQIYDESYYVNGKPCNVSRFYYDSTIPPYKKLLIEIFHKTEDSLNFVYKRVQPLYERVYDAYGRVILSKEFSRVGKLLREAIIDPDRKFETVIHYHDNGVIASIMYSLDGKNFGHYQTYDQNGFPDTGWEYDENGNSIISTIKKYRQ